MTITKTAFRPLVRFTLAASSALTCLALVVMVGCKPATPPAAPTSQTSATTTTVGDAHEDDGPETYAEGLEELTKQHAMIKEAFETDKHDYAHDPLHEVGHILEALPQLAAKDASLTPADTDAIKQAVDQLFEAFGTLDETFHGGEDIVYSEVEEKIQGAISTLKDYAK